MKMTTVMIKRLLKFMAFVGVFAGAFLFLGNRGNDYRLTGGIPLPLSGVPPAHADVPLLVPGEGGGGDAGGGGVGEGSPGVGGGNPDGDAAGGDCGGGGEGGDCGD